VLPGAVRKVGETQLKRYTDELAAVRAQLEDADLAAAAAAPVPDLTASGTALELAEAEAARQARTATLCESGAAALGELNARLAAHLATARPLLDRFATADDLARCTEGTGGDNTLRMSLAAYVMAARLEEVAAAASARLAAMSGGRYTLEHHDEVERGRGRSGLGLRVLDGWTGRYRLPASLSGGETFYTSLALALGLADVVAAEAGGITLETLFVDEGFGTLDEDTLEDVMGVLDELRSGGRVVGLVSHVDDLRQRIPSRLEVRKTRAGSQLRTTGAA
jgi:exonuclease SbcC